ncbi:tryptophan halogenase [Cellvibrio sp. BR]|uniref:tryptophan halogenase family protein n=1 Tax=Cellvibrio sp. BR TaxID=1134474 RepID=UPI000260156E|nr:tryptophan halogenase family protein [Cellvibrio sp. BR]EIK45854.1 tryptophan halogenase [Cellvibrio sp. BR]
MTNNLIQSVVIVGGGTAGWLTAGIIAAEHQHKIKQGELQITLCESPSTPIIGVGEGTWPTMRATLKKIGVSETAFIRECDVAFKQGSKFLRWKDGSEKDFYYHPFSVPQGQSSINLAEHWLNTNDPMSFSTAFHPQEAICEASLAPKTITTAEYDAIVNYGYHLNAGRFAEFLRKHCLTNLHVDHILAEVTEITQQENGHIQSLITDRAGIITGDLFVDCTGFTAMLLGETLGVEKISISDILFTNCALATQIAYPYEDSPIASATLSSAQTAGWIWDIGLPTRRGVGHVFAKEYQSIDHATQQLINYIDETGGDSSHISIREIHFNSGYRKEFWKHNCVAVGLSAGFLEPLEASALVMVELSALMIAEQLPRTTSAIPIIAKRFNERFSYRWERAVDFLKLHYLLNQRNDSPFWQDNRQPSTTPLDLSERLLLWQNTSPQHYDFDRTGEIFHALSYQYVLYGMGFKTNLVFSTPAEIQKMAAELVMKNKMITRQLLDILPTQRKLLQKINLYGLSSI